MKPLLHKIDSDIKRGIERWENEGGRLPFVGSSVRNSNNESDWLFPALDQAKPVVPLHGPPNMNEESCAAEVAIVTQKRNVYENARQHTQTRIGSFVRIPAGRNGLCVYPPRHRRTV